MTFLGRILEYCSHVMPSSIEIMVDELMNVEISALVIGSVLLFGHETIYE